MKCVFTFFLFFVFFGGFAQLTVSNTMGSTQLVNNVLLGPGVVASNIQYTGASQAIGYFNGVNSNIGLGSGVIISTGKAVNAVGPNNTTSVTTVNSKPGNIQLTQIAGQPTLDAAILEFDFVPSSDTVRFRYVFASEEYYEGVCTPFNDVFAFLINGPGITGTVNIALVPGTNQAVSISSVNGGVLGDPIYGPNASYTYCVLTNTVYYVDNTTPPGATVQYDGFTKVFTAKAKVTPCETYHIKLAIADGGNDNTWDSSVFLEAGSFNSHFLTVNNNPRYVGAIYDSAAVEGCGEARITFKRYDSIPYPRTVNYTLSGTASPSDYIISAPNIHFLPGQDSVSVSIKAVSDNITESKETLILTLIPDFIVCNGWTIPGGKVSITDNPPFEVSVAKDQPICPYDSVNLTASVLLPSGIQNNSYHLSWNSSSGNMSLSNPLSVFVENGIVYTAQLSDSCGMQKSVSVVLDYDCPVIIPNVITPNNDGANDKFSIKDLKHFGNIELFIFNRWGNLIYQMRNYDNSWSPVNIEDGVYFYVIETSDAKQYKGYLSVFK